MYQQIAHLVWKLANLDPDETLYSYDRVEFAEYLEQKLPPLEVLLNYCVIDNGDGSASPAFFKTPAGAEQRAEYEQGYSSLTDCEGQVKLGFNLRGQLVYGNDYVGQTDDYKDILEA